MGTAEPFDAKAFERLLKEVGEPQRAEPPISGVEPLASDDIVRLPSPTTAEGRERVRLGEEAFRRGEVAALIVAGGAGTRFGGVVKGLVPVLGEQTFLDFKLENARRIADKYGKVPPIALMTSELTDEHIRRHLSERLVGENVLPFCQRMLPRLTVDRRPFRDAAGQLSFAPSGHGDFFRALRETGLGERLLARGIRHLYFSNVDNLGATLDPLVIGMHIHLRSQMTVELTSRQSPSGGLDAGAAPVRFKGRVVLFEQVNPAEHPLISTNNMTFDLPAILEKNLRLPYRLAKKEVEGTPVLQIEQVTADASGLVNAAGEPLLRVAYLEVPRGVGDGGRFAPVKTRADLPLVAAALKRQAGEQA